ncbi:MAG: hypothetical protein JXK07_01685 [Spirochaetes bacterium]|nr:hypothetical protein [Spirochaetota bacterium]MBN2772285.1 hypothetical protein [Spirochaetota bacterium]
MCGVTIASIILSLIGCMTLSFNFSISAFAFLRSAALIFGRPLL